jgi:membrane-bound serine protease (ClpP class)
MLVEALTDPNVAYLLFTLGLLGILAEIHQPGMIVPGVVGGVALALSLVGFAGLPLDWRGVALISVALALMIAELHVAGFGALGLAGVAAFVAGSLMLFEPEAHPGAPPFRVDPWLIAIVAAGTAAFVLLVLRAVVRAQRGPVATGIAALIGRGGIAASPLAPHGTVQIDGEPWTAESTGAPIDAGTPVVVAGVEGVTLRVHAAAHRS